MVKCVNVGLGGRMNDEMVRNAVLNDVRFRMEPLLTQPDTTPATPGQWGEWVQSIPGWQVRCRVMLGSNGDQKMEVECRPIFPHGMTGKVEVKSKL